MPHSSSLTIIFIAKRQDGLGERFRAIINAIALSKVYGGDYKITWNDNKYNKGGHAIAAKEKIFSPNFIKDNIVSEEYAQASEPVQSFLNSGSAGIYHCDQNPPVLPNAKLQALFAKYLKNAFKEIDFSADIKSTIRAAENIEIGESGWSAIHLRAGDLIYGPYKTSFSYLTKAISFPIAEYAIGLEQKQGRKVIIFGQDEELIKHFSEKYLVTIASDFVPLSCDRVESAFFEIVLMSRCSKIYAGSSGFAVLASAIRGISVTKESEVASWSKRLSLIVESVLHGGNGRVSREQISYACKSGLVLSFQHGCIKEISLLINEGRKVDGNNFVYLFCQVWLLLLQGAADSASKKLLDGFNRNQDEFRKFIKYNFATRHQISVMGRFVDFNLLEQCEKNAAIVEFKKNLEK